MSPSRNLALVALVLAVTAITSCERNEIPSPDRSPRPVSAPEFYKPAVSETFGAAVVILLDTSGSMGDPVPGASRTKDSIAREAIESMLRATEEFTKAHPQNRIRIALMHFSGTVSVDLPISDYSPEAVKTALTRIPKPDGKTAIGEGLREARRELYRSGCMSKHILVITDGENTTGVDPEKMAREIFMKSEGRVKLYFVAFDTDPKKFAFLRAVGGEILSAKGESQLEAALKEIYEDKILAEEMAEEE